MKIEQRFSNGKNYIEKKVKRGYLRANEENLLMMLMTIGQLWKLYGNMEIVMS